MPGAWRVLVDLAGIAVSGGLYIVPLYSLVQTRSEKGFLSRTIAAINIVNALFMVASAGVAIALLRAGLDIPQLFLVVALMNVAVALFIFSLVPEFLMRLIVWAMMHSIYRVERSGFENLPRSGAALLICNHVSYADALIIASASRRPIRFVMYHKIFRIPVLSFVFRTGRAIPIAPAREDPELLERAYDDVARELEEGNLVCIFPEGALTRDGEMQRFRSGIEKVVARTPVPVIPMALSGLWGSVFSRKGHRVYERLRRGLFSRVHLAMGEPVPAAQVDRDDLYRRVLALRGDVR
jgi:1-acyl-sn-glycerol-3-phosphate acyltransferase